MNYRIKQIATFLTPIILVVLAILVVKDWNQGELTINNAKNTILRIENEQIKITSDSFKKSLWPNKYNLSLEKDGYYYYKKSIDLKRGDNIVITPEFVFIPKIEPLNIKTPYQILPSKKLKDKDNNNVYTDNQDEIAHLKIKTRILKNVPNNILYILFNPTGEKAIIITSSTDLKNNIHYLYDVTSDKLIPLSPDKKLSGFSWNSTGDKFTYFEPMKETEGRMVIYDTTNSKISEITRIYDLNTMYTSFINNDSRIAILGVNDKKDIVIVNIKNGRKEKLTNSGIIDGMKVAHNQDGIFYKEIVNSLPQIYFLELKENRIYKLEKEYEYLRKIDYLSSQKKVIYTQSAESILDLPKLGDKDSIKQDKYYLYDLTYFQTSILPITNLDNVNVKKYIKIDKDEKNIIFSSEAGYFYKLTISE